ncbi:MAG: hypothetical protein ACOC22_01035 [bacterium]
MKGNSNIRPKNIIEYGRTGSGQVLFNIDRKDKEEDGVLVENWEFEYCEVSNFRRETIISGVIRSRYSQDEAEAILANYQQRKNVKEYLAFQEWRELAKSVADGKHLKSELAEHYEKQLIKIKMPFSFAESGGKYEALADRVLKLMRPHEITKEDGVEYVTTWLIYIEPEYEHIAEDPELVIEMVNLI